MRSIRFSCTLVLLTASVMWAACARNDPKSEVDRCPLMCIDDPVHHRLVTKGCLHSGECPSGTVCVSVPNEDPQGSGTLTVCPARPTEGYELDCSQCDRGRGASVQDFECRLAKEGVLEETALTNGFNVKPFQMQRDEESEMALFDINVPRDARTVVCALFGCVPVIRQIGGRLEIVNFDQCALAMNTFLEKDAAFGLGDPDIEHAVTNDEHSTDVCKESGHVETGTWESRSKITGLSAGCWAYDDTRLIAATKLKPVLPTQTYLFGDHYVRLPEDCGDEAANGGKSCYVDSEVDPYFGTCHDGQCRRRCVDRDDCTELPIQADGGIGGLENHTTRVQDGGVGGTWSCQRAFENESGRPMKYVGVCIQESVEEN